MFRMTLHATRFCVRLLTSGASREKTDCEQFGPAILWFLGHSGIVTIIYSLLPPLSEVQLNLKSLFVTAVPGGFEVHPDAEDVVRVPFLQPIGTPNVPSVSRAPAGKCARVKDLGYVASKQITMYGQRLELVSDPVQEGDGIVVEVISGNDPTLRRLQLPVSILLSSSDRWTTRPGVARETCSSSSSSPRLK